MSHMKTILAGLKDSAIKMRIELWLAVALIVLFSGARLSSAFHSNIGWVNLSHATQSDTDSALSFWLPRALDLNRSSVSAHMGLGVGMTLYGDPRQGVSHLDDPGVMLYRPELALLWAGEAQLRLGQFGRAAQVWRTLAGEDAGMQILLAKRLLKAGEIDQSIDKLPLYLQLSELSQLRNPPEAISYAQLAVAENSRSGDAYALLAWALYQQQRNEESVQASRAALNFGLSGQGAYQTWGGTYEVLGRALLNMGSCQESRVALEESIARASWVLWPHIALGQAYLCLGDNPKAVEQFRIALGISPGQPDAEAGLRQAIGGEP